MPLDDNAPFDGPESFDGGDDDLALYVAAFREVEQPDPARRDANWRAIAATTAEPRRRWLWIAATAAAIAATWVLVQSGGDVLRFGRTEDPEAREQAGYVHGDGTGGDTESWSRPRAPAPTPTPAPVVEPVVEAPVVEAPAVAPTPVPETTTPRPRPRASLSLADETALFGEIQRALVEDQPRRALEAIARHERDFPRGAFRNERVVAKARALCAAGRRDAAIKLRDRFLAQHGDSHLAPSMRAVCSTP